MLARYYALISTRARPPPTICLRPNIVVASIRVTAIFLTSELEVHVRRYDYADCRCARKAYVAKRAISHRNIAYHARQEVNPICGMTKQMLLGFRCDIAVYVYYTMFPYTNKGHTNFKMNDILKHTSKISVKWHYDIIVKLTLHSAGAARIHIVGKSSFIRVKSEIYDNGHYASGHESAVVEENLAFR